MRWRPFHLALLLFQAFWLNVVVPGHTRGSVLLPGTETCCSGMALPPCCAKKSSHERKPHSPTPAEQKNCAICFFAAHLMLPPPVDFLPKFHGDCEALIAERAESAPIAPVRFVHSCRGPPISVA